MRRILIFTAAIGMTAGGHAETYKCMLNGAVAYQQQPCASGTAKATLSSPDTVTDDVARAHRSRFEADNAARVAAARVKSIDDQIAYNQTRITAYEAMMDSELSALRAKKYQARNNLAGATWEQSISTEMEAVAANYATKIRVAQDEIEALRKERMTMVR